MDAATEYLKKIQTARSPAKAALYIRALATASLGALQHIYGAESLMKLTANAETRAQTLERPWSEDSGPHPWREWLHQWGYIK